LRLTLHNLPAPAAAVRGEEEAGSFGGPNLATITSGKGYEV
jgi:hypothetical protein